MLFMMVCLAYGVPAHPSFPRKRESIRLILPSFPRKRESIRLILPSFPRKRESIPISGNASFPDGFLLAQE
jgi:pyoverdine/dityrosine biosynthesis protein Dit1